MNNEVEEFLRRAAQRRAQVEAQLRAQAEARARGQGQAPPPRTEPPKRITPATQKLSQQQPVEADVIELASSGSRVGDSVAERLRHSQDFTAQVELLGDGVESADEEMAAHLHQAFGHAVGRLRKTTAGPVQPTAATPSVAAVVIRDASPAHGIAELLRNPQSVRNAIILSEVINRPADRW
ncbi:MAG TPA: hypothetical protein VMP01_12415 [Pirellulaceae bacterium]|nr:hypothetical protein [Pirellulaceae bacterium]